MGMCYGAELIDRAHPTFGLVPLNYTGLVFGVNRDVGLLVESLQLRLTVFLPTCFESFWPRFARQSCSSYIHGNRRYVHANV